MPIHLSVLASFFELSFQSDHHLYDARHIFVSRNSSCFWPRESMLRGLLVPLEQRLTCVGQNGMASFAAECARQLQGPDHGCGDD